MTAPDDARVREEIASAQAHIDSIQRQIDDHCNRSDSNVFREKCVNDLMQKQSAYRRFIERAQSKLTPEKPHGR